MPAQTTEPTTRRLYPISEDERGDVARLIDLAREYLDAYEAAGSAYTGESVERLALAREAFKTHVQGRSRIILAAVLCGRLSPTPEAPADAR